MKKTNLYLSIVAFTLILFVFVLSAFSWLTITDNNEASGTDLSITDLDASNYVIDISGFNAETADLYIRPNEVREYELTVNNLSGETLTINTIRSINTAYIVATNNSLNYFRIDLSDYHHSNNLTSFYTSSGSLISELYNLYNGIYESDGTRISEITNGSNTIHLYYHDDKTLYNVNEYYTIDDKLYPYGRTSELFEDMIQNANIYNAIKYYFSDEVVQGEIAWDEQPYLSQASDYVLPADTVYLYLYFDPFVYVEYDDIVLRNSNPFLFQALSITFLVNVNTGE